jgi:probable phosphoglycerate mutase
MSVLSLFIVRHGESEGNRGRYYTGHSPSPLTELGHRQAEAVATRLQGLQLDALYASDLLRARQTAEPLARLTSLPILERPSLRERSMGDITGIPFDEAQARHPEVWQALSSRDPAYRPPGGESHQDCGARVAGFLQEIFAAHPSGRLAVISHGIAINHMLVQLLGAAPGASLAYTFRIDNCALTHLDRGERGTVVVTVNDRSHLG